MKHDRKVYEIKGTVRGRNGDPIRAARVVVWSQQIRERKQLAKGATSPHGTFALKYEVPENNPQPLLLVVEATSKHLDAPLVSALTPAQPTLEIDLNLEPTDQSEWTNLVHSIEPLLDGLALCEIVENSTNQDISFLALELGKSTEVVMRVAVSARLETAFGIPAPVVYAFLCQRVPAALPNQLLDAGQNFTLIAPMVQRIASLIFGLSAEVQTQTLTAAIALDLIGPQFTDQIPQLVSELQALHATDLLHQPYLAGNTTPAQLLEVAGIEPAKHAAFGQALASSTQPMHEFWRKLGEGQHGITATEASAIEHTFSVGALVDNLVPLTQKLVQGFASGSYQTLPDLARLSLEDWVQLVNQTDDDPGTGDAEATNRARAIASAVHNRVTRAYPTVALSSRIAAGNFVPKAAQQPLALFFQNNPSLELIKHNIPVFLASQGEKAFAGIAQEDRATVVAHTRSFQRVLHVAPNPNVAQTLLGLGIKSATEIATLGQQQFSLKAAEAGLSKSEANHTFQAAAHRYANVVSLYTQFNSDSIGVLPKAIGQVSNNSEALQQAITRDQSLATLFGSQDYCATDDCTSILSPAAYLCDLLLWLRNHKQGSQTALDVLDSRRPDIRHLLLNCSNTDTELPYIDLVNELLADKINPPTDATTNTNPLWKQTSANTTAAELNAAPEYFNQGAYATLFAASYPFALPYSTGLDGLRTYLQRSNLPLWQLRQAFLPPGGGTLSQQVAVAAERFGMAPHAVDLISSQDAVPATVAWNTANPLVDLAKVPAFLQAANITYESLRELLQVTWVQGSSQVAIQGIDDTCATDVQTLSPLDAGFLDRAHRFLRLWRASGYKMWELDLLLRAGAVGNGKLDQDALVAMLSFRQLQDATGLSVERLLAFYQDFDTATHLDPDGRTSPSLYAQIFLNEAANPFLADPVFANLVANRSQAADPLSQHLAGIQAGLGTSAADVATALQVSDLSQVPISVSELSLIYRVKALAMASKLSISDLLSVAGLLSPSPGIPGLFTSPKTTLAFLTTAKAIRQSGLSIDAMTYLLTPPPNGTMGDYLYPWGTTTQITQANIASVLKAIQRAVLNLLLAGTTLAKPITATDTSIIVANDAGFPAPNFYAYIGSEIVLVTAVSGAGNTTWTVVRGQRGTIAAVAPAGSAVTPTRGDLNAAVVAAVAANGRSSTDSPLANDVAAVILKGVLVPSVSTGGKAQKTILEVLTDPLALKSLIDATATITIGGSPVAGDTLEATIVAFVEVTTYVRYTLTQADSGNVNQTASNFADAINASSAVVNKQEPYFRLLAPCTVSGAVITLRAVTVDGARVSADCQFTATPAVSVSPASPSGPTGTITISGVAAAGDTLQTVVTDGHQTVTVSYKLTSVDDGSIAQTASHFANAINHSKAIVGPQKFLAPCTVSGATITLKSLTKDGTISSVNTATAGVTVSPGATTTIGNPGFTDQFRAIQLFDKIGILVRTLHLVSSDLSWLIANAKVYGGIDFNQLPVKFGQPMLNLSSWLNTLLLVKLARLWTAAPASSAVQTLYDVIGGVDDGTLADEGAAQGALATITGWSVADIQALAKGLGLSFPDDYKKPETYDNLRTLEAMAATTGASGAQIVNWSVVPADEPTAESIAADALAALKAQQPNNDAWLALAPSLMNPIRERRSAALQAWLTAQRDASGNFIYGDVDGLFDYFLIDTQMSSCQATSRTVQAYIAVQIFVERCFMNLEPEVVVDLTQDDTWNQWEWMKRYRIWEANREVFLYPENWLIESQRPNRTEIYQKLEQEVHQGQSTTDHLETIVLNYIDRLDGLAHLLVTGTCQDPVSGTIHVVARSPADPPAYHLRSYADGAWTGWAEIPLGIKALHVIPAVYRGRLCLFWPDVKLSNEPQQQTPAVPKPGDQPAQQPIDRYATLEVHFSIFRDGKWAPAQVSKGKLFDKPPLDPNAVRNATAVEGLYTLKVQAPGPSTTLSAPVPQEFGAGMPTIGVASDMGFPPPRFNVLVDSEPMQVVASYGNTNFPSGPDKFWQVLRLGAQQAHNLGAPVISPIAATPTGHDANLWIEVFRSDGTQAQHVGRAIFDGRFNGLELNNSILIGQGSDKSAGLLSHAQSTYGPDAQPLLPLDPIDPNLTITWLAGKQVPPLTLQAGALATLPADPTQPGTQTVGLPALITAPKPFRIVGPDTDLNLDPDNHYYFFQDNRRCYYSQANILHMFYHPFTRLFWNQLSAGGFDSLYELNLQQAPESIDPSGADVFSFKIVYQPTGLIWDLDPATTLQSDITADQTSITVVNNVGGVAPGLFAYIGSEILQVTGVGDPGNANWTVLRSQLSTTAAPAKQGAVVSLDRQFLDFSQGASFSVYNWELFYHIPLYIAQILSQDQQFENAETWFHYIFNPTRQGSDPVPQRFWITKPLHNLTGNQILDWQINRLLEAVNSGNPVYTREVASWRKDPFNPFLLADLRPVAYMKSTVMSYLDNLVAWGDNLFSTESREALSEATLLYVIASEILGPAPVAVTPPGHAEESYDQLEPKLDAFANALVEIENVIGGAGSAGSDSAGGIPGPQTFYFKIPSNAKLLGYWTTVADRLYKLRHCQNIAGEQLQLALFDAPIDPGLLIAAQAAGVDLSSVLSDLAASLPNYRFTALYPQALDFVNAVRAYGFSLQAALEKGDAGALALLQQTTQQQLLTDGNQILDWQVQQAQSNIDALNQTLALANQKYEFNREQSREFANPPEITGLLLQTAAGVLKTIAAGNMMEGAVVSVVPSLIGGAAGAFGTPVDLLSDGGSEFAEEGRLTGTNLSFLADVSAMAGEIAMTNGNWLLRKDNSDEAAAEAQIQITQANIQLAGAQLALQIAQQNQTLHQEQIDNIQQQIDFLNQKFTSDSLYDWMVGSLSATYFQSYQLAYQLCKQVERGYQFELGIQDSSFIQFGYWDSLHKGLLSGETLNHDLRRMQASYLQQNARRYELSRFVSLATLDATSPYLSCLEQLLATGTCDFSLPESLFDNDYPGHYNRRLTRVSMTVVYPNPGKFDNVKATLTLVANKVRIQTDNSSGYEESTPGSDPRFLYNYAAVPQKIAMGNAQDDPGLFVTAIAGNIADQRYLPFENAGAVSTWRLEMPQLNNEVDLSTVGDVVLHLHYTALDGGDDFRDVVQEFNKADLPTSWIKVFSALNDFPAPSPTAADPNPLTPWQAFLTPGTSANQTLTLNISPSKFPVWTRGKKISVTSITLVAVTWPPGNLELNLVPALATGTLSMSPVSPPTEGNLCASKATFAPSTPSLGEWSFELRQQGVADWKSLTNMEIGDVLLLVTYDVSST